jgi:hypothetical protein
MTGKMFRIVLFLVAACMAMGCAAQKPMTIAPAQDLNPKLAGGEFIPKVDNFVIILDGTLSMADPYRGTTKSAFAKGLASLMNQTIPDMKLTAGLRTFGDLSAWDDIRTISLYGMTSYTRAALDKAIKDVKTSGNSPLELAITGASEDLKGTSGNTAVIIFSDGEDMDNKPILAARGMKALHGDRICIYTVQTGNSPVGKILLEDVAREGICGFFVTGDSIASSEGMADFVEKVFFMRKAAAAPAPAPMPAATPPAPPEEVKEAKVERQAAAEAAPERITLNVLFDRENQVLQGDPKGRRLHDEVPGRRGRDRRPYRQCRKGSRQCEALPAARRCHQEYPGEKIQDRRIPYQGRWVRSKESDRGQQDGRRETEEPESRGSFRSPLILF